MLNGVKIDLQRTFRTLRILYILIGSLLATGLMLLIGKVFQMIPGSSYTIAKLFFTGTREGFFALCQCLFVVAMIVVDYEYGNIKNICSVTKKRSDFIVGKLIYIYIISLLSSAVCMVVIAIAGYIAFPGQVTVGNPAELLFVLVAYSIIVDMPLTIVALFAMRLKRAAYCTYVLIGMYFLPGIAYGIIEKNLHISIQKISVLQYVFGQVTPFKMQDIIFHAGLAIVYTLILFFVTVRVANRTDAI